MISLNSLDIFLVPFSEKQILVVLKNVEVNEKKKKPNTPLKKSGNYSNLPRTILINCNISCSQKNLI